MTRINRARFDELDVHRLYAMLRLRAEVFVVEQSCAFNDVDGRDVHPETVHYWIERPDTPDVRSSDAIVAMMRVLPDDDGRRKVSRVVTAPDARSAGLAGTLVERAIHDNPGVELVLDAQSRLVPWYSTFGFEVCGAPFDEDGIEHTPMRRRPRP